MKKPSPISKQIKAEQQKLAILQTTVKASQEKWDDQKKQIAKDTQVTIVASKKAIAGAITSAKEELSDLHEQVRQGGEVYLKQRKEQEKHFSKVQSEIQDLEYTKKVLVQTNTDLNIENRDLKSSIIVQTEEVASLKTELSTLERTLSVLRTDNDKSAELKESLLETIKVKTEEIDTLEATLVANRAAAEQELAILEVKKQTVMQEILENRQAEDKVRENLAIWEEKLNQKDKNLRIREARASEQEKSIQRNYNLLNL